MTTRTILLATLPIAALLLGAGTANAQGAPDTVRMFERAPTVDELRQVVKPDTPIRTRGIEIIGGATVGAARKRPDFGQAGYNPPSSGYGAPASAYAPQAEPAAAQPPARPAPSYVEPTPAATAPPEPPPAAYAAAPAAVPTAAPAAPEQAATGPAAFGFNITFGFNSADIPVEFRKHIDAVGTLMQQEPTIALLVEGHTDATGSEVYNEGLSQRRAAAVQRYLTETHGIAPQRLVARGKGEHEPLVADPYDASNRRVQFARIQ